MKQRHIILLITLIATSLLSASCGDMMHDSIDPYGNITGQYEFPPKILVGGSFTAYNNDTGAPDNLCRLNPDGSLDRNFNYGGQGTDGVVNALVALPGGRILVGGNFMEYKNDTDTPRSLCRLKANGEIDRSFNYGNAGVTGGVRVIALQQDGKIIIGGTFSSYNGIDSPNNLVRLNRDGSLDNTFNSSGTGTTNYVTDIAVQPDGKIIVVGGFGQYNGTVVDHVCRITTDGTLDSSFNNTYVADFYLNSVALEPDGEIVIGGGLTRYNGDVSTPERLCRLNKDGSLDTSFNYGNQGFNDYITAITLQPDGTIIAGGVFASYNSDGGAPDGICRILENGSLDTDFNYGGSGTGAGPVNAIVVQSEGTVLIGGDFTSYNGDPSAPDNICRLNPDGTLDEEFNYGNTGADGEVNAMALQ